MKRIGLVLLIIFTLVTGDWRLGTWCYAQEEETFTITTYYPAPYGVYKNLKTTQDTYLATDSGNVGIGTTSPLNGYRLHVNSPSSDPGTAILGQQPIIVNMGAGVYGIYGPTVANLEDGFSDTYLSVGVLGYTNQSDAYAGYFSGGKGVRIADDLTISGNVGIGTTSPEYNLQVVGKTQLGKAFGAIGSKDSANLLFYSNSLDDWAGIGVDSNKHMWFRTGVTAGNAMIMLNDGNVGIGGVNSTNKLEVFGTAHLRGSLSGTGLSVDSSGNVGIGTTGPVKKLNVVGPTGAQFQISGWAEIGGTFIGSGQMLLGSQTIAQGHIFYAGDAEDLYIDNSYNNIDGDIRFRTRTSGTAVDAMIIQGSGNVGIGTTNPAGKLDVNGTIYQRGLLLHADYVFEPEYELESIEEHSQYMWQNKHLKAVPRAKIDENGQEMLEIGAHRRGILEELEKAHVYIQKLNERIKKLETKIKVLEG